MAKTTLRAVAPDEKAAPKTITEAASGGTHRELLVAMRDRIAQAVEDPKCPPRDLASLTLRLAKIAEEIKAFDSLEEEGPAGANEVEDGNFDASAV